MSGFKLGLGEGVKEKEIIGSRLEKSLSPLPAVRSTTLESNKVKFSTSFLAEDLQRRAHGTIGFSHSL